MNSFCDHEFAIGGLAGRFPLSNNLEEFWELLIQGVNMVTDDVCWGDLSEWSLNPRSSGRIKCGGEFDNEYFGVPGIQAYIMDPGLRILLELSVEAIIDAGINPSNLSGNSTGVFAGAAGEESLEIWKRCAPNLGYAFFGGSSMMMANRVSYSLNLRGPSLTLNTGCSSSLVALAYSILSMKTALCTSALVSGVSMHPCPRTTACFNAAGFLSAHGKIRSFDEAADGFVRAEAAVVAYVCRHDESKRCYAVVVHAKTNSDGYKPEGVPYPSLEVQEQLMRELYAECGVNPADVSFCECHGSGTMAGDVIETSAISNVLCVERREPLLIGSVKSNLGHTEAAAGMVGVAKVILANQKGTIPANLHFTTPNARIPGLKDGRLKVVTKPTPFVGPYAAVSSYGVGGSNAHVLLKFCQNHHPARAIPKDLPFPVLLPVSGRTEDSVRFLLKKLSCHNNENLIALIHEVYQTNFPRHSHRAYSLLGSQSPEIQVKMDFENVAKSVWFVFNGIGPDFVTINDCSLRFSLFDDSVQKSVEILSLHGVDVRGGHNLTDRELLKTTMVTITVVQVALVDLLSTIGVLADGIIGHSLGEIAAGYADGSLKREDAIAVSLCNARAFAESSIPEGKLLEITLDADASPLCYPEGIFPAIYNSEETVVVAGLLEDIEAFEESSNSEGMITNDISLGIYAFHSPIVETCGDKMRELLENIGLDRKPRSPKWLSTSVPQHFWSSELSKYSSTDYYVNNISNPVYFHSTLQNVRKESIVLEIGPETFMQTLIELAAPPFELVTGIMNRNSEEFMLQSLGNLFIYGCNFKAGLLYNPISFPVDGKTPSISPMIRWDHSRSWAVPDATKELPVNEGGRATIDLSHDSYSFLSGHVVDGNVIFPAVGYIWLVWKAFAFKAGIAFGMLPVVFTDIRFERSLHLKLDEPVSLEIILSPHGGAFEVFQGDAPLCSGNIKAITAGSSDEIYELGQHIVTDDRLISGEGLYKEFRIRGYYYSGAFESIALVDYDGKWAKVEWKDNWVGFLDAMLQTNIIKDKRRQLRVPTRLEKLIIDPTKLNAMVAQGDRTITVINDHNLKIVQCPGIQFSGLVVSAMPNDAKTSTKPSIFENRFASFHDPPNVVSSFEDVADFYLSVVIDNTFSENIALVEMLSNPDHSICNNLRRLSIPKFPNPEYHLFKKITSDSGKLKDDSEDTYFEQVSLSESTSCIFTDIMDEVSYGLAKLVPTCGFLFVTAPKCIHYFHDLLQVSQKQFDGGWAHLYRRLPGSQYKFEFISLENDSFEWVETVKESAKTGENERLYLTSHAHSGIIGLVKCLILEQRWANVRCIYFFDEGELDLEDDTLKMLLRLDLAFNARKRGSWGCYCNFTLSDIHQQSPRPTEYFYGLPLLSGDLNSLNWVESPLKSIIKELCDVKFTTVVFRDVLLATGRLHKEPNSSYSLYDDHKLGYEYAGIYLSQRVCGVVTGTGLANALEVEPDRLIRVPPQWSMAEAITIVPFYTAYATLAVRARLSSQESVLIHSGTGGTGLAAIALALSLNSTVFATAGTQEKRDFLKQWFPGIQDAHVSDSRNHHDFERCISRGTNGRGVDVVLNSLSNESLKASIRCVAEHGRFIEIGLLDMINNTKLGMQLLLKGITFFSVSIINTSTSKNKELIDLIEDGISTGTVKPLPFTTFSSADLQDAFKHVARSRHIGKVVIGIKNSYNTIARPKTFFHPEKVYIVVGGLGGMGLELIHWMASRNARKFVVNSRLPPKTSYQCFRIGLLQEQGIMVTINNSDVSTERGASELINIASARGRVGGIFNLAMVLDDALFSNQTSHSFEKTCKPKLSATFYLDALSRTYLSELDYFVVFSSVTAGRGNPGQTNYGYANSSMERICEQRKLSDLPALAIQWGPIADVGAVAEALKGKKLAYMDSAIENQNLGSWLQTMDLSLQSDATVISSFVLKSATSETGGVQGSMLSALADILGVQDISELNPNKTLTELGVDSLMLEQVQKLVKGLKVAKFSEMVITGNFTIAQFKEMDMEICNTVPHV